MQKKWIIEQNFNKEAEYLARNIGVSAMVADMMIQRGIKEIEKAKAYMDPVNYQKFYDPFLLKDMDKAVKRIIQAIKSKELIVIYGDYDMDGMTATALLVRQLKRLGANVDFFVPLRENDGYGLHMETLERIRKTGVKLLISVDCGITALAEVKAYKDFFDIIITDHHLTENELPEAVAAIDPKRQDDKYPDNNIAGVGVAFKLCQALWSASGKGSFDSFADDLELVAMGTIADMVPLVDENRKIAALGLKALAKTRIPGLQALLKEAGIAGKKIYEADDIGFKIAPRFNAIGRMDNATKGVRLLLEDDDNKAAELAALLNSENIIRQEKTKEIFAQADKMVAELDLTNIPALVLAGHDWHAGIVGLVASRLQEKYYLPVIVISIQNGIGKGSCRSIKGLHIRNALQYCTELLERFGGHEMAAGLTVKEEKIDEFRSKFFEYVREKLREEDYVQSQQVSFVVKKPRLLDFSFMKELDIFKPYGKNNEAPFFACFNIKGEQPLTRGEHLFFEAEGVKIIGWRMAEKLDLVRSQNVDIIFKPEINDYRGISSIQFIIKDIRPAKALSRERLGEIYMLFRQYDNSGKPLKSDNSGLISGYKIGEILKAKEVFKELGLLEEKDCCITLIKTEQKKELYASKKYCEYLA